MLTQPDLMTALSTVIDPELGKNIVELGMVRDLTFTPQGEVAFTLSLTIPGCPLKNRMKQDAEQALLAVPGVKKVEITFGTMSPEEREAVLGKASPELPKDVALREIRTGAETYFDPAMAEVFLEIAVDLP